MRGIKSYPYLNYVSKESNKMNDLILDRDNDEKTMSGITEGMHKIAIHSQLIGLKTLLKISNSVGRQE
jgi:hypothetical protein